MKINDVIVETEQLDELTAAQAAAAVGKGAGAVAKGVGAVAGGVAGAGKAFMKGFRGGKATVAGDDSSSNSNATRTSNTAAGSETPAAIQKQIQQKELEIKGLQNRLKAAATPQASTQAPTKTTQSPQANPVAPTANSAAQGATAAPTAPGQAPAASNKNAAAGDTYEKAKGDIRKVQSGSKPMPPKTAAGIDADLAKLAKGDKESGVAAAQKIMTFAKSGVNVSKQQQAWVANSKAGERFLTQSVYFEISKMLREHKLSWSDLGIRVHLLEGTNQLFGISIN